MPNIVVTSRQTATKGDQKHTILFDTGPEEAVWETNAGRLRADIGLVERIHLSHWHRDHSGGMLRAIKLINDAKPGGQEKVTVDLHPDRPTFRGVMTPAGFPVSLEADPTFEEIEAAGGVVEKNAGTHAVCDGMFLISGEIPRKTDYEVGIRNAIRLDKEKGQWKPDELIMDERLVMCNLKGEPSFHQMCQRTNILTTPNSFGRQGPCRLYWL